HQLVRVARLRGIRMAGGGQVAVVEWGLQFGSEPRPKPEPSPGQPEAVATAQAPIF
ncbi:hypothetical protein BD779DRAFT_1497988, partial [Infundibulicybe gibba]